MESSVLPLLFLVISVTTFSFPGEDKDVKFIVRESNRLAVDVHKRLSADDQNVFFSPLSISTVLAMLLYGARGITAAEIETVLGYQDEKHTTDEIHAAFNNLLRKLSDNSVNDYTLYVASAVLTQEGFPICSEYVSGLKKIYEAIAREVDFSNNTAKAIQQINTWVKLKTNGQIQKLLRDVDPYTVMILLNAVYFKGTWKTQFDPKSTLEGIFYNKNLESLKVTVPMMTLKENLAYARLARTSVLELPYKGRDISMIVLLPDVKYGLTNLENELTPNVWKDVLRSTSVTEITVMLPKFKLEYEKTLNQVLWDLGIKSIFSNPDLSGISAAAPLEVSKVIHKAVIEVNEEGSEASSVSGVSIVYKSGGNNKYFIVNRPFLFSIFDKRNDLILFQGRVNVF